MNTMRKIMNDGYWEFYNGYIFSNRSAYMKWLYENQYITGYICKDEIVKYKDKEFMVIRLNNWMNPNTSYLAKELKNFYDELYGDKDIWLTEYTSNSLIDQKNFLQIGFNHFGWDFVELCKNSPFLFDRAFAQACYDINHGDTEGGISIPNAERIFKILKVMIERYKRNDYVIHKISLLYNDIIRRKKIAKNCV